MLSKQNPKDFHPVYRSYPTPIVPGLLERGDLALEADDWPVAYDCYVAAYFCNGGTGDLIKTKIGFVQELIDLNAFIESSPSLIESARYTPSMLELLIIDLKSAQISIDEIEEEIPASFRVNYLAEQIATYITRAQNYLDYK